ncbi:hypothetical protein D3C73_827630 [compost metagenome]
MVSFAKSGVTSSENVSMPVILMFAFLLDVFNSSKSLRVIVTIPRAAELGLPIIFSLNSAKRSSSPMPFLFIAKILLKKIFYFIHVACMYLAKRITFCNSLLLVSFFDFNNDTLVIYYNMRS